MRQDLDLGQRTMRMLELCPAVLPPPDALDLRLLTAAPSDAGVHRPQDHLPGAAGGGPVAVVRAPGLQHSCVGSAGDMQERCNGRSA